jgi:outer membrane receptor protein involved in Fe transport
VVSSGYSWNWSFADGSSADMAQTVRTATQRFKMNMYVTKQLTLAATVEDNYNNLTQTDRHAWFGDVQAKYKLGKADLELEVNNVFNQKTYTRVNYSGLDIHTATSRLRPMSVVAKVRFKLM